MHSLLAHSQIIERVSPSYPFELGKKNQCFETSLAPSDVVVLYKRYFFLIIIAL